MSDLRPPPFQTAITITIRQGSTFVTRNGW